MNIYVWVESFPLYKETRKLLLAVCYQFISRWNILYPRLCFWPVSQSVSQSVLFFLSLYPMKPLNRISWNFVVIKDIMCRWAYPQEILIRFFSQSFALFELRNLANMKDTTETVCQPVSQSVLFFLSSQLLWNRSTEFPETL